MTSTLLERAPDVGSRTGGIPARRAIVRWSWHLFCREWRQQLRVLILLAVAVAATIVGAAVGTNMPAPGNAIFGAANSLVSLPATDPHLLTAGAAIRDHFGEVDVVDNQKLETGSVHSVELRSQNPRSPLGRPTLSLVAGRFPQGIDQVALTPQLATLYDLGIGGAWHHDGQVRLVVGLVENPDNLLDEFALVAPGQIAAPNEVTVLFDSTRSSEARFSFPEGVRPLSAPPPPTGFSPAVIAAVFSVLGMIPTCPLTN